MRRVLLLLPFALIPAVLAAPVPPGARTEFGTGGLLSRADLEKVKFDSRPAKEEEIEVEQDVTVEKCDIAVHLPWTKFREGEPVPAYFVVRNRNESELQLRLQMELFGPWPIVWSACRIKVRDRATGKVAHTLGRSCSKDETVTVPAGGYACFKGDVGQPRGLKPGEYEVEWIYAGLRAVSVPFTVEKTDATHQPAPLRPYTRFFHIAPDPKHIERPAKAGEPFFWHESRLDHIPASRMAAALAVGQHGVYVPDVHTIPTSDKLIEASIQWKPYREGDRIAVTLRAAGQNKQVRFAERPQLFLQTEAVDDHSADWRFKDKAGDEKRSANDSALLVTPLTIEVRLPPKWRENTIETDEAHVAVLVVAKPLEWPTDKARAKADVVERAGPNAAPVWSGIVRTPFTKLRFPFEVFPYRER